MLALVSIIVSTAGYKQDATALDTSLTPAVNVVSYEATTLDKIPMELTEHQGEHTTNSLIPAAAVDVVVENLHGQSALITRVDAEVRTVYTLRACGAGELKATAKFDIKIPTDRNVHGQSFGQSKFFEVEGNRKDEFAVSVGPVSMPENALANIFHIDLLIRMQSGETLRANDIMLMTPGTKEDDDRLIGALSGTNNGLGGSPTCLKAARGLVDAAVSARATKQSPRLAALHAKMHAVGY
ncbi:hypothetical protein [Amycolatopsis sp. lyj-23]|uniref:hypothetical protein n=1 Tax=Amycolatopsis sp. lyj-23 TaxID=2789283 RepID=UPI00397DD91B